MGDKIGRDEGISILMKETLETKPNFYLCVLVCTHIQ